MEINTLCWIAVILLALGTPFLLQRRSPQKLMPESLYIVTFDDEAIAVKDPAGVVRRVRWDRLTKVGIRTTDEGPSLPDVFWGFHAGDDEPVVFPGGATGENELIPELNRRLPGFRNDQLIAAMRSTSNAFFVLWLAEQPASNP